MPVVPRDLQAADHLHEELVRDGYFVIQRHHSSKPFSLPMDDRFHILMTLDGRTTVTAGESQDEMAPGSTLLVPATAGQVTVQPEGEATVLDVFLP